MIDFSTLQGLNIPEGVVTQIADASGRVLWSAAREVVTGTIYLRPSADISVEHTLNPANSTAAYLLINEEVADGSSTYVRAASLGFSTSKFKLSSEEQPPNKQFIVTSVNIAGETYCSTSGMRYENEFKLEINGVETTTVVITSQKDSFDVSVFDAVGLINEYIATNGTLPSINITVISHASTQTSSGGNKGSDVYSGVTQVYVVLGYEA